MLVVVREGDGLFCIPIYRQLFHIVVANFLSLNQHLLPSNIPTAKDSRKGRIGA